ncbi:MAG: phosphate/phosphite/phosphonate ABC transporter substrate-binding protein [Burkholderiales bacterium]|nr:phosphate/phosphite/phosphonate ABC transporter substrate-binding protein [Burkholderiales bacterium]
MTSVANLALVRGAAAGVLALLAAVPPVLAQDACPHRGELDTLYCDVNRDLVADPPTDPKKFRNPGTLVFAYTPVEDPAVYERIFRPFTEYLAQCTGKRVVYFQVQSNAAQVEAMRSGRLHVGGFSTGPTAFAVNLAGAVPFAVKGDANGFQSYRVAVVVRADSPIRAITDLKDRRVAHTSPSSNSGNLAPRALFPALGVTPDKDYKVLYSGGHDRSVLGVRTGDYDAAPVASDVFARMIQRGTVKESEFRVIWQSDPFPTSAFAYAHDLEPSLRDRMLKCFYDYRYPEEMRKAFDGADRFYPVTYLKDWEVVRKVAAASGESFGRAAFEALAKREEEARAKKAAGK